MTHVICTTKFINDDTVDHFKPGSFVQNTVGSIFVVTAPPDEHGNFTGIKVYNGQGKLSMSDVGFVTNYLAAEVFEPYYGVLEIGNE